jgi:hypothetical protein
MTARRRWSYIAMGILLAVWAWASWCAIRGVQ